LRKQILATIIGHCCGDVIGLPVQFTKPDKQRRNPLSEKDIDNIGKGLWSDDTSLSIAFISSFISKKNVDYDDIMCNFQDWLYHGKYTQNGQAFDIGRSTAASITRYTYATPATLSGGNKEKDNGNGGIMRLAPASFIIYQEYGLNFFANENAVEMVHNLSSLTHAHPRSLIGAGIYIAIMVSLLDGMELEEALLKGIRRAMEYYRSKLEFIEEAEHYSRLENPDFKKTPMKEIKSSGYIVDTLEAVVWTVLNTTNYKESILQGINLGGDSDSIAAITGSITGLYYGYDSVPKKWISSIPQISYIEDLCEKFYQSLMKGE